MYRKFLFFSMIITLLTASCGQASSSPTPPLPDATSTPPISLTHTGEPLVSNEMAYTSIQWVQGEVEDKLFLDSGGDVDTAVASVGSPPVDARRTGNGQALTSQDGNQVDDYYMQFRIDDSVIFAGSPTTLVQIEVEYFNQGTDSFVIQYDALAGGPQGNGLFKETDPVIKTGSQSFKTAVFTLDDAYFSNRDNGADFRIDDRSDGAEIIRSITVTLLKEPAVTADTAEIIFYNGHVITMEEDLPLVQAIAIQDEFILAVGTDEEILALAGADTQVVDLNGLTVTPGFIDSHSHRIVQRDKWDFLTIEDAAQEALSLGWTGLVELAVEEHRLKEMIAADAAGELHTRVNAYLVVNTFGGDPLGDWYQAYKPGQQFSPYLRIAGLKIFIDFNSGRVLLWEQDELNQFVSQRQLEGWQVTVKAISIQSHELALNAYAYALDGESNDKYRYRIEHSVAADDAQVARMAEMPIIASIQTSFPAVIWNEEDIRNLGEEEGIHNLFRWRDYMNAGVFMVASSYNPPTWDGSSSSREYYDDSHISALGLIYRSVTQIRLGGTPPESWMLERALTVDELFPLLTINGAYATFEEDVKGSLSPGKWADFVILSDNPLTIDPDSLIDLQVLLTMVGGNTEYCMPGHEDICP